MNFTLGSEVVHHGKTLIVGHAGRLYEPRTSVDAWGRTRRTQKVTKYRIVPCGCGQSFIAHDTRMKQCPDCQAQVRQARCARRTVETPPPAACCVVCGQSLTAQRRTRIYCSRACQQHAYRKRHQRSPVSGTGRPGSSAIFPGVDHLDPGGPEGGRIACGDSKALRMSHGGD